MARFKWVTESYGRLAVALTVETQGEKRKKGVGTPKRTRACGIRGKLQ